MSDELQRRMDQTRMNYYERMHAPQRYAAEEEVKHLLARITELETKLADQVSAERVRQVEKGYTPNHDDEHGVASLLAWAMHYENRGELVKALALVRAARESGLRTGTLIASDEPGKCGHANRLCKAGHCWKPDDEAKATEDQRWQAGYDEGYRDAMKESAEPPSIGSEAFNYVVNDPGMGEDD